jgi:hypothetical protein
MSLAPVVWEKPGSIFPPGTHVPHAPERKVTIDEFLQQARAGPPGRAGCVDGALSCPRRPARELVRRARREGDRRPLSCRLRVRGHRQPRSTSPRNPCSTTRNAREAPRPSNAERLPSEAALAAFNAALLSSAAKRRRLEELRGWTWPTLEKLTIGVDGTRLTLPVHNAEGDLVNVVRYLPGQNRGDQPKLWLLAVVHGICSHGSRRSTPRRSGSWRASLTRSPGMSSG